MHVGGAVVLVAGVVAGVVALLVALLVIDRVALGRVGVLDAGRLREHAVGAAAQQRDRAVAGGADVDVTPVCAHGDRAGAREVVGLAAAAALDRRVEQAAGLREQAGLRI